MRHFNVLIVGGGPAGSSVAWGLRERGLSVAILDRKLFPRDKVCAGWITPGVVDELRIDLEAYGRGRTLQPIHGFRVSLQGRRELRTLYAGRVVSYGIRRCEFDEYLLRRSGAELLEGMPFRTMEPDGRGWRVNAEIRADVVVGAGGHFCPVARMFGAEPGTPERVVAAQEIEFEMTTRQQAECPVDPRVPELFFAPDLAGYGWVFRKGGFLNVGLGREDSSRLTEHVQAFVAFLKEKGRIPGDLAGKFHGHAYLLYPHSPRDVVAEGLLLVGDAAGLAYAESGEGIRPAVESGLLAARVIASAAGDYGAGRLGPYRGLLEGRFGPRQPAAGWLERVPPRLKRLIAGPLMQTHWFVQNVLMERWFLRLDEMPLPVA